MSMAGSRALPGPGSKGIALREMGRETQMPGLRPAGWAVAIAVGLISFGAGPASARHHGSRAHQHRPAAAAAPAAPSVYADEHDCIAKKALDAPSCHNAFVNSRAEYEEKA